jgi:hypothetical protein
MRCSGALGISFLRFDSHASDYRFVVCRRAFSEGSGRPHLPQRHGPHWPKPERGHSRAGQCQLGTFGRRFTISVSVKVDAQQPMYVSGVAISGQGPITS